MSNRRLPKWGSAYRITSPLLPECDCGDCRSGERESLQIRRSKMKMLTEFDRERIAVRDWLFGFLLLVTMFILFFLFNGVE